MKEQELLDSWKKISIYLDREIRTCYRWEKELGLPVHRIDNNSSRSKVFTYKSEIDQWLREKANNEEIKKESFFKSKWILRGLASGLALFLTISAILYYSHRISSSSSFETPSIAVLPFKNLNSSEYDEYFSEGVTNEIINSLISYNKIKVIPIPPIIKDKNAPINIKKIGKELGIEYVLQGNIKKDDDKVNLHIQLIKTKDNADILTTELEEHLEKFPAILDNICLTIVEKLNLSQKYPIQLSKGKTDNFQAIDNYFKGNYILSRLNEDNKDPWKLYHQGQYYNSKLTQETNELAIKLFNQAVKIDPFFTLAYIGLSQCYANYVNFNWNFDIKWINKAEELLKKAQTIEPNLPEYYCTLIKIYLMKEIGFNESNKNIIFKLSEEAIKKYPDHPELNSIVGYCYYLKFGEEGNETDFNKALAYKEKSFWLNPYGLNNIIYAGLLMLNKEFQKAIEVCNIIVDNDRSLMTKYRLGEIYYYSGELEKSETIFQQFNSPLDLKIGAFYYLAMIASQKGEIERAKKILNDADLLFPKELKFFHKDLILASIYMGLGERELGYSYLKSFFKNQRTKKMRNVYYKYIDIDKNFSNFDKEKLKELLEKEKTNGKK